MATARGAPGDGAVDDVHFILLPLQESTDLFSLVHAVKNDDRCDTRLQEFGIEFDDGVTELPVLAAIGPFHGVQRVEDAVPVHNQRPSHVHSSALSARVLSIHELSEVPDPHRTVSASQPENSEPVMCGRLAI